MDDDDIYIERKIEAASWEQAVEKLLDESR